MSCSGLYMKKGWGIIKLVRALDVGNHNLDFAISIQTFRSFVVLLLLLLLHSCSTHFVAKIICFLWDCSDGSECCLATYSAVCLAGNSVSHR